MKQNYIELDEFLRICNIKKPTFLRRYKDIPGVEEKDGSFKILEGTRFPYNMRGNKLQTTDEKRYVLLKAINENKYIDNVMLKVFQKEFENLIKDLCSIGFIETNGMDNTYGANAYRTTSTGGKSLKESRRETIKFITLLLSEASGKFVGEVLSKVMLRK